MHNRILLIITIILSIIYLLINSSNKTTIFYTEKKNEINVKNTKNNKIEKKELEDYIIGVVSAEMPASFHEEALKAQAIAARTYAAYKISTSKGDYDIVTDVSNQGYISVDEMKLKWNDDFNMYYEKVKKAVNDTSNLIMKYDNEIVRAYYFAMSNGYTENVSMVFGEEKKYLQSVSIMEDKNNKNFEVKKEITKDEICNKFKITCEKIEIKIVERSNTNRVNKILLNNKEYKGTTFRYTLGLRSTDFDIIENNNSYTFITRGYGHGVGMSQYGANHLAEKGMNYEEILRYFYKNVEITKFIV